MFKTRRLVMLLGIIALVLSGCKDNSKNNNASDRGSSSKTEGKNNAFVTIHLDDGSTVDVKTKRPEGSSISSNSIAIKMTDYKLMVMLTLKNTEPIKKTTYKNPEVELVILTTGDKSPIKKAYRSYFNESEDGKLGDAKVTFTSISETHAEGTFTGTVYTKKHRKATIEGKFRTKRKMRK